MLTDVEVHKLGELQELLFNGIKMALDNGVGNTKHYEGAIDIHFPNYFDAVNETTFTPNYGITVHCYILGPSRHSLFEGDTLEEAIDVAMERVREWVEDEEEWVEGELDDLDDYIPTERDLELIEKIDIWLENG